MIKPTVPLLKSLFGDAKDYGTNRLQLLKMKAVDKTAGILSAIVLGLVMFVVFFIFFVVFNIGLALLIGHFVGGSYWGFLILAGFYALAGIILFASRNKIIKTPITTLLIKKIL